MAKIEYTVTKAYTDAKGHKHEVGDTVSQKEMIDATRRETGIKLSNPLIFVWIMLGAVGVMCIIEIIKMF